MYDHINTWTTTTKQPDGRFSWSAVLENLDTKAIAQGEGRNHATRADAQKAAENWIYRQLR